jgi:acyl-CoA reductase-like NAD-dependent aldehyde dehydrogenase
MQFKTINPINNQLSVSFPMLSEIELNTCIESSHNAFKDWKHLPASDKKSLLEALSASIEKDASDCARLMKLRSVLTYVRFMRLILNNFLHLSS